MHSEAAPILINNLNEPLGKLKIAIERHLSQNGDMYFGYNYQGGFSSLAVIITSAADAGRLIGYSPLKKDDPLLILETNTTVFDPDSKTPLNPTFNRIFVPVNAVPEGENTRFSEVDFIFGLFNDGIKLGEFNITDQEIIKGLYENFITKLSTIAEFKGYRIQPDDTLNKPVKIIRLPHIMDIGTNDALEAANSIYLAREEALLTAYRGLPEEKVLEVREQNGYISGEVDGIRIEILPLKLKDELKLAPDDAIKRLALRRPLLARYYLESDPANPGKEKIIEITDLEAEIIAGFISKRSKALTVGELQEALVTEKSPPEIARLLRSLSEIINRYCGTVYNNNNDSKSGVKIEQVYLPLPFPPGKPELFRFD